MWTTSSARLTFDNYGEGATPPVLGVAMWKVRHTEFKHRDFFIPRSAKEIYGVYLTFDDPVPWYRREKFVVTAICVTALLLAFGFYRGGM